MSAALPVPQQRGQAYSGEDPDSDGKARYRRENVQEPMDSQRKTDLRSILFCVSKNPEAESLEHARIEKNEASQAERQNYASHIPANSRHQALPVDWRRALAAEKIQPAEHRKGNARLLHEEGQSQQEAAGKQLPASPGFDGFQQEEDPGQREHYDKVRCMRGKAQDCGAGGKKNVG